MQKTATLLVMKLTIVLLTAAFINVQASGVSQTVTLSGKNMSLETVFNAIRKQTNFYVMYDPSVLAGASTVNADFTGVPLKIVLDQILKNQPLTYFFKKTTIVITPKSKTAGNADALEDLAEAPVPVSGIILGQAGQPLSGVNITVKGSKAGTITDARGTFILNAEPGATLVFSYIGYVTREARAAANMGTITMTINESKLDELQVIAYGNTTRRLSTGSTGKVSGEDIAKQPVSNPILALAGRVPGVFITQTAGYSGANMSVVIRGQNSFTFNSASPLYVVDGIPFASNPVEQSVGGFSAGVGFSPLNTINPSDIESINILKDADATAIYGSRGANGVILIITKKVKSDNTKLNLEFNSGFGEVTNAIKMLNTEAYLKLRREAFTNDNVTPTAANAPDLMLWDQKANTNFPELIMGKTSHQTNASFSLSGGDTYTQFMFGGNYRKETTVYNSKTNDNAVQFHLHAQHKSRNNKFNSAVSASYNLDNNTLPSYNVTLANYSLPPNYPLYNPDGTLYFGPGYSSPLASFNAINNLKSANLTSNIALGYTVLPGLELKATAGFNHINVEGAIISPASSMNPANNFSQTSVLNNNYIKTYIAEPQLTYRLNMGRGKLNALLGSTWQETQTVQPYWLLATFTNLQLAKSLGALTLLAKSSGYIDFRYASAFSRVEYTWDDKYLFSGNIRRDGSSRFGASKRFGTFGSAAVAWIFSKESFVSDKLPWLSFGKVRASYGTIGNDKVPDYSYQSNYSAGIGYGPVTSLSPARIANPYLQWEVTKKLDIALELGFLRDRLLFTANYYRNRSGNLLGSTPLPIQTGFPSYNSNLSATIQNKGLELELSTVNVKKGNLTWTSSFNLTLPQNKLLSFPGLLNSSYSNTYVVGQSLNLRTVFHSTGIVNGIATAEDINKDGAITTGINGKGDFIIYGNNDPKFYGGLNNSITYKNFQLDFLFQVIKRTATRGDLNFGSYPGTNYNLPVSLLDVGLKPSATTGTPGRNAYFYYTSSDAAVQDASFVRLKNISLAYNLPLPVAKRLRMSALQVYMHAQNLLTFTSYKGLDPETLTTNMPPLKMLVTGIKVTF